MFSSRGDEFIVQPLWNETTSDNAASAAADNDDDVGVYHIIYRRSALRAASAHSVGHCGLHGSYSLNSLFDRIHKLKSKFDCNTLEVVNLRVTNSERFNSVFAISRH